MMKRNAGKIVSEKPSISSPRAACCNQCGTSLRLQKEFTHSMKNIVSPRKTSIAAILLRRSTMVSAVYFMSATLLIARSSESGLS